MISCEQNPERSAATDDDSSTTAGLIKTIEPQQHLKNWKAYTRLSFYERVGK
ncbi:MAG: hypothetical protein M3O67_05270 [Bacteroidota bacterium]|nr:hypothetical protein [Bacteroidota bacterium]